MSGGKIHEPSPAQVNREALLAQQRAENEARLRRVHDAARASIGASHESHARLARKLDAEQRKYPTDLQFDLPALPLPEDAQDLNSLQNYAESLAQQVADQEKAAERAIASARAAHEYRAACLAAWSQLHENNEAAQVLVAEAAVVASALGEPVATSIPSLPSHEAQLSTLRSTLQQQEQSLMALRTSLEALHRRLNDRQRAAAQTGSKIVVRSANEALDDYKDAILRTERLLAQQIIQACLVQLGLAQQDLPKVLGDQLPQVEHRAAADRMNGLLRQHKARKDGMDKAQALLADAPEYANPMIHHRWENLVLKLTPVAKGVTSWDDTLTYEHQVLKVQAHALMQAEYQMSCVRQRAAESNLDVVSDAGLVNIRLKGLAEGYAYEVRPIQQGNGRSMTHYQLVADSDVPASRDTKAMNDGCQQLLKILAPGALSEADNMLGETASLAEQFTGADPRAKRKRRVKSKARHFSQPG